MILKDRKDIALAVDISEDSAYSIMQGNLTCFEVKRGLPFAQNNEEDYQKVFSSCMAMLDVLLLLILRKQFGSRYFKFAFNQHIVQTLHL
jgi:hypothetical protein